MIQGINSQPNLCKYQFAGSDTSFGARGGVSNVMVSSPAKIKRNKILKAGFFVFLGVKVAMLADLVFAKGKHIKILWNKIFSKFH